MHKLKILYGYPYFPSTTYSDVEKSCLAYVQRLRQSGFDVEGFCLTLTPPNTNLTFRELNARWKRGDKELLHMYKQLETALIDKDVLINAVGINLHPDFVKHLPVFTVFQCFDDPESSYTLSKPAAFAYDLSLAGNIAEVNTYRKWGVENVEWIPLGLQPDNYDPTLTFDKILNGNRDIDLFMMIDRFMQKRQGRLDKLAKSFPNADFYGRGGWPKGILPYDKVISYLGRSKIGPNLHLSTGPINSRTYYLPGNGVLQICDNKKYLGEIYKLGKEVVGYDTIDECIDLCKYYLDNDEERRKIAANGWKRALKDYSEIPVFSRTVNYIEKYINKSDSRMYEYTISEKQNKNSKYNQFIHNIVQYPVNILKKTIKISQKSLKKN